MKKSLTILIIVAITITMLTTSMFSINNSTKAQVTSGIVSIVFDDGLKSPFDNAFPVMQAHGFVGTYYILTAYTGTNSDYMNVANLHTLQTAGNEIASHSVDHPDFTGLTDAQINQECSTSKQFLQTNGFQATNFAYPYGVSNNHVDSIVLQYYRSARYAYGSGYLMPITPTAIQMSIPIGYPGETGDTNALPWDEATVQQAHDTNSWVIIFFHNVVTTPATSPYEIEQSKFAEFLDYVANSGVQVKTVNQALDLWSSSQKVTVLPSAPSMDVGQQQTFTASPYGGTSPYHYQWYLDGSAITGQIASTYTYTATTVPSHTVYVRATDSASTPVTTQSNTASVTVNPAPTVSVSPSTWTMDVGQSKTFTATPADGSGTYTAYHWYVGGVVQSGATASTFSYSPGTSGSYSITASVTDSLGATSAQSSAASVTVSTSPTVSITPAGPITLDAGQIQVFTATTTGGSGSLSYTWYLDGLAVGINSADYSYTATGSSHSVTCKVTDSASTPVTSGDSNAVSVTVNPALVAPGISASVGTINHGQTSILSNSSAVTTGTSPFTYQWFQKAPSSSFLSISNETSNTYSFNTSIATVTGTWNFILQVRDNVGGAANSSVVSVTVNPAISASVGSGGTITPSGDMNFNYGDNQTFSISANPGYYIVDVIVNGTSVGAVNSYTFTNIQTSSTISATFAAVPTSTPQPTTHTISTPTPTPVPTSNPTPTQPPTTTPTPTTPPKQTQSSLSPIVIVGIASAIIIAAVIVSMIVFRSRKSKN
jgi:peptidoglycan/xylan/chitin deacetylase (PgdA/CDA1 family)